MKKVLVIVCVAAFMLSIATVAMASETSWLLAARASTTTFVNASGTAQVGCMSTTGVTGWTDSAASSAGLALWSPAYTGANNYAIMDRVAPLSGEDSKTWEYRMWLNPGWASADLVLSFWNLTAQDIPETIGGVEYVYTITMLADPTQTYAPGDKWVFDATKNGTSTGPAMQLAFSNFDALKMTAGAAVEGGVKFTFTAAPFAEEPPIPEPGSMLALASGLVGMAGYAIRRRRA